MSGKKLFYWGVGLGLFIALVVYGNKVLQKTSMMEVMVMSIGHGKGWGGWFPICLQWLLYALYQFLESEQKEIETLNCCYLYPNFEKAGRDLGR